MHNELFSIGPITIYGYGLMIGIGILAAYLNTERMARKYGLDPEPVINILIVGVGFGIVGAKLLYYITILDEIIKNPRLLLDFANGFVVYGGIIGGILAAMIYCRVKKLPFLKYFDLLMPSVALAQGFGRIGCFLAGCCYGKETESMIGIVFHDSAYAPNGVSLLPTQLISSGLNFLHFVLLVWLTKKKKGDGQIAGLYLVLYSVGRFILEFFRGDLIRGSVGGLSTSQFIAIFVCLAGVILIVVRNGKFEENPSAENESEENTTAV